jgi:hypothetical protein
MIDPALRKLRLDRRMVDRRGWIAPKELERELAGLPDVAAKIAPTEDADEAPDKGAAAETAGSPR